MAQAAVTGSEWGQRVHIRDAAGKLLYTRLYDNGGPSLEWEATINRGVSFAPMSRETIRYERWRILSGWPTVVNGLEQQQ